MVGVAVEAGFKFFILLIKAPAEVNKICIDFFSALLLISAKERFYRKMYGEYSKIS